MEKMSVRFPTIGKWAERLTVRYRFYSLHSPPKFMPEAAILSEKEAPQTQSRSCKERKRRRVCSILGAWRCARGDRKRIISLWGLDRIRHKMTGFDGGVACITDA